jgi:hypothetical protein
MREAGRFVEDGEKGFAGNIIGGKKAGGTKTGSAGTLAR